MSMFLHRIFNLNVSLNRFEKKTASVKYEFSRTCWFPYCGNCSLIWKQFLHNIRFYCYLNFVPPHRQNRKHNFQLSSFNNSCHWGTHDDPFSELGIGEMRKNIFEILKASPYLLSAFTQFSTQLYFIWNRDEITSFGSTKGSCVTITLLAAYSLRTDHSCLI